MGDDPTPEELAEEQETKEHSLRELAEETDLPDEEHAALRRADKAAYLREKLAEQEAADEAS